MPTPSDCSPVPWAAFNSGPTSTVHQLMVLPFFCGSGSMVSTRPITSGPVISRPGLTIASSLRPVSVSRSVISSVVVPAGTSTRSRIQDRGAFIARSPLSDLGAERAAEPDVALEERSQVLQVVAEHERTVNAHAEGEAAVDLRVDAAGDEHARVHHAAAAPLDPALAATGAARLR